MRLIYSLGYTPKQLQNPGHKYFFNINHIKMLFPGARIYGYFPYMIAKFKINRFLGFLSPTFVIIERINRN
jgi:hypothetical protein